MMFSACWGALLIPGLEVTQISHLNHRYILAPKSQTAKSHSQITFFIFKLQTPGTSRDPPLLLGSVDKTVCIWFLCFTEQDSLVPLVSHGCESGRWN